MSESSVSSPRRVSGDLGPGRSTRAPATTPPDTKTRILTAAARHFGVYGYEGASLRNILTEASANSAAANYHFGSKAGLYKAVINDYFGRTREHRLALLGEAEQAPENERLLALTRALMQPHFELIIQERQYAYGRLYLRLLSEPPSVELLDALDAIRPTQLRYLDGLRTLYPDASEERLLRGIGLVVAVLIQAPFNPTLQMFAGRKPARETLDEVLTTSAAFGAAGLAALLGGSDR